MQGRQMLLMAVMLSFVACGDSEDTSSSGASSTEEPEATEATEAVEAAEPAENANTRDIHGLRVTVNDDGTIAVQGVDRWGGRLDTVYADATYFRNAVPVLKRSVTEEQGTGLDELLETLPEVGTAPAPSENVGMEPAPIAPPAPATMTATMVPAPATMAPAPATMAPAAPIEGAMAP